jgi:hypothetical protein
MALTVSSTLAAKPGGTTGNPHVVGTPSYWIDGNSIMVSFDVAGLGTVEQATFDLTGQLSVYSRCYNRGGNKPQADNKQENVTVGQTATFPVRNGRTNATFTVTPLSTLQCPGNQVVVIESASGTLSLVYEGSTLGSISVSYVRPT